MDTKQIIIIGAAVVILGAGWFIISGSKSGDTAMMNANGAPAEQAGETMTPKAEDTMAKDKAATDATTEKAGGMMKAGSYEPYSAEKVAAAGDSKVLLFFHADWCPLCRPLDADITANLSKIPSGIAILKVNYDTETALKQKYGVTYQHTIVEVNSSGTMIKKWTVINPTLAATIAEIQ